MLRHVCNSIPERRLKSNKVFHLSTEAHWNQDITNFGVAGGTVNCHNGSLPCHRIKLTFFCLQWGKPAWSFDIPCLCAKRFDKAVHSPMKLYCQWLTKLEDDKLSAINYKLKFALFIEDFIFVEESSVAWGELFTFADFNLHSWPNVMAVFSLKSFFTLPLPTRTLFCCYELHDEVIKWKHFPRNWPFVRGIHWSPVTSPQLRTKASDAKLWFFPWFASE